MRTSGKLGGEVTSPEGKFVRNEAIAAYQIKRVAEFPALPVAVALFDQTIPC
jgi:hypothetical protein